MLLIIGLGNPGEKYARTRHNAGFLLLDEIRKVWNFPAFGFEKKFNAEISEENLSLSLRAKRSNLEINHTEPEIAASPRALETPRNDKLLLIKPQTFMNNSGDSVRKLLDFYKLTPADIIVVHDDLDLEIGKYKISTDSSAAGHNGVQDIFDKLGTQQLQRVRLGVETAGGRANRIVPGEAYVLQDFTKEEYEKVVTLAGEISEKLAAF